AAGSKVAIAVGGVEPARSVRRTRRAPVASAVPRNTIVSSTGEAAGCAPAASTRPGPPVVATTWISDSPAAVVRAIAREARGGVGRIGREGAGGSAREVADREATAPARGCIDDELAVGRG